MHVVMDREVSDSNSDGVECFFTRLVFESSSSDISRFMFSIFNFEKSPLGVFPYRAYLSHENYSPKLTKTSNVLLKGWWSICVSYFFCCFNSRKVTSVYRGYFPAICRLFFLLFKTADLRSYCSYFLTISQLGYTNVTSLSLLQKVICQHTFTKKGITDQIMVQGLVNFSLFIASMQ